MLKRVPRKLAAAICILLMVAGTAYALNFNDVAHMNQTIEVLSTSRQQLSEMKKQFDELQAVATRIGGVALAVQDTASMRRWERFGQCLIPNMSGFTFPDGFRANFSDLCSATKSAAAVLFESDEDTMINGNLISLSENHTRTKDRRNIARNTAIIEAYALSQADQQNIQQTHDVSDQLIDEANAAQDLMTLMRVMIKAQALTLSETANLRSAQAAMLELQATTEAARLSYTRASQMSSGANQ